MKTIITKWHKEKVDIATLQILLDDINAKLSACTSGPQIMRVEAVKYYIESIMKAARGNGYVLVSGYEEVVNDEPIKHDGVIESMISCSNNVYSIYLLNHPEVFHLVGSNHKLVVEFQQAFAKKQRVYFLADKDNNILSLTLTH